jgi:aspartate 1-decarboxylase
MHWPYESINFNFCRGRRRHPIVPPLSVGAFFLSGSGADASDYRQSAQQRGRKLSEHIGQTGTRSGPKSALQKCGPKLSLSHPMQLTLLKSKIHRATVTGASLHYEGSLTVSADIAKMVGLLPYEKILVGNLQNGKRFETYVIYGASEGAIIELNGATAHLGAIGDRLTIMSFASLSLEEAKTHRPRIALLDAQNRVIRCEEAELKERRSAVDMALAGE